MNGWRDPYRVAWAIIDVYVFVLLGLWLAGVIK